LKSKLKLKTKQENDMATIQEFEATLDAIKRQYGENSFFFVNENYNRNISVISTGSIGLDYITGVGGLPRGKIVEIFGDYSSGKSTILLNTIANANKMGEMAALIDVENSFDPNYAEKIGVCFNKTPIFQPDSAEDALNQMVSLVSSGSFGIVCLDSVGALVPKVEIEGNIGDSNIAITARLMAQTMRKIDVAAAKTKTLVLFANQIRDTMGFGPTTTGGRALKFFSSIRIDIKQLKKLAERGMVVGIYSRAKIVKSKISPPFKQTSFTILFGKGISVEDEIIDYAAEYNLIKKGGSWYSYNDTQIGQGRESVRKFLKANPEIIIELKEKIIAILESEYIYSLEE